VDEGAVTFRATRVGEDTALAQIVGLVRRAQSSKAPGQRLADKAAQYPVILAVGAGVLIFAAWLIFDGRRCCCRSPRSSSRSTPCCSGGWKVRWPNRPVRRHRRDRTPAVSSEGGATGYC